MKTLLTIGTILILGLLLRFRPSATSIQPPDLNVGSPEPLSSETFAPAHSIPQESTSGVSDIEGLQLPTWQRWLDTLNDTSPVEQKLSAARDIANLADESAYIELARFITTAELSEDPLLEETATQVAAILSGIQDEAIQAVATELAYSPSTLVAAAAVDSAIGALKGDLELGEGPTAGELSDQRELDQLLQNLFDQSHQD